MEFLKRQEDIFVFDGLVVFVFLAPASIRKLPKISVSQFLSLVWPNQRQPPEPRTNTAFGIDQPAGSRIHGPNWEFTS
jgi:hypothetical protein